MGWEYRTICTRPDADEAASERRLDSMGRNGWELVSAVSAGANYIRFFFKRALSSSTGTPSEEKKNG